MAGKVSGMAGKAKGAVKLDGIGSKIADIGSSGFKIGANLFKMAMSSFVTVMNHISSPMRRNKTIKKDIAASSSSLTKRKRPKLFEGIGQRAFDVYKDVRSGNFKGAYNRVKHRGSELLDMAKEKDNRCGKNLEEMVLQYHKEKVELDRDLVKILDKEYTMLVLRLQKVILKVHMEM